MAHINKVMKSINGLDDCVCVDVFIRPDGTYGFEEYRRDFEDARGWFPIGHFSAMIFNTQEQALICAAQKIVWLADKSS